MDQNTATTYRGLLEKLQALISAEDFKARYRQKPADFTRQRCLTFTTVIIFLSNLVKRSLQDELDEFFKLLSGDTFATRVVTKSAFTQARRKLKYEAFIEMNQSQVAYFYAHCETQTWQGWRLVAIDGSMSDLPATAAIGEHFGVWQPAAGGTCPKARLSQLFDVLNHITLDAQIAPKAQGERSLAEAHCDQLQAGDLVLLDRGYPAFWLFARILKQQAHFCARMSQTGWKVVEQFLTTGLEEQIVTLTPGVAAHQACRERELSPEPFPVRLLRIQLDNGTVEVLLTSLLDTSRYPYALFPELYHQRWPVEEDYKVIKSRTEVENWSGKSVWACYQDFHAKIFTKNLTTILATPAQKSVRQASQTKKYVYQVNMSYALSKMKDTVVLLLQRITIAPLLARLWLLLTKTIEPLRPNRSYSHQQRVKPRKFAMSYKPLR